MVAGVVLGDVREREVVEPALDAAAAGQLPRPDHVRLALVGFDDVIEDLQRGGRVLLVNFVGDEDRCAVGKEDARFKGRVGAVFASVEAELVHGAFGHELLAEIWYQVEVGEVGVHDDGAALIEAEMIPCAFHAVGEYVCADVLEIYGPHAALDFVGFVEKQTDSLFWRWW